MKTILLTGGTGFVGSALAAELLSRGHSVLALSRNDPDGQDDASRDSDAAPRNRRGQRHRRRQTVSVSSKVRRFQVSPIPRFANSGLADITAQLYDK